MGSILKIVDILLKIGLLIPMCILRINYQNKAVTVFLLKAINMPE
jgi:hypothetical protein